MIEVEMRRVTIVCARFDDKHVVFENREETVVAAEQCMNVVREFLDGWTTSR